jgi:hypothetical protein
MFSVGSSKPDQLTKTLWLTDPIVFKNSFDLGFASLPKDKPDPLAERLAPGDRTRRIAANGRMLFYRQNEVMRGGT